MLIAATHNIPLTEHARLFIGGAALVFVLAILEMIRRHRLQERYTILWLLTGFLMLAVAIYPQILGLSGALLGLQTPGLSVFALGFLALILLSLHLTTTVSRQGEHITRLAEELAIERAYRQGVQDGIIQQPPRSDLDDLGAPEHPSQDD